MIRPGRWLILRVCLAVASLVFPMQAAVSWASADRIDAAAPSLMQNMIAITMLPSGFSYIKGLCDGGLILILLGLMWLFVVRRHRALLAGWFFALAMALFVELGLGFAGPVA